MARYNVTCVTREGFIHTAGFNEVIDSVAWSLASLGHDVSVTQNWFSEVGETNIIFGAENIVDWQRLPSNTVLFNLEQPSHPHMDKVRRLARESNAMVWDYSQRAVEEWRKSGHERVQHVPIGFTPNLTRIPRTDAFPFPFDVCFFGWATPRRTALLEELRKAGLHVYASSSCYGGGRDAILLRSKLALNVHHDGRDRFEIVRCSYLMANSIPLVTEVSSDDDEYQDLKGLIRVPYRMLLDSCAAHTGEYSNSDRRRMAEEALESIRRRDFPAAIAAALDSAPAPSVSVPTAPAHTLPTPADPRQPTPDPHMCVALRYNQALLVGDMKDFVAWMREHARSNVMEIGVRDGASTSAFLLGLEEHGGHLYSVDVQPCGHLFAGHPQWTFIQANSTDVNAVIKQIPFELDLLLIDGDHSRAGVLADITYARNLRPGGMILFHDIAPELKPADCSDPSWPSDDVKNVYEELCASMEPLGWTHFTLPGRYGLGVLVKPAAVPIPVEGGVSAQLAGR